MLLRSGNYVGDVIGKRSHSKKRRDSNNKRSRSPCTSIPSQSTSSSPTEDISSSPTEDISSSPTEDISSSNFPTVDPVANEDDNRASKVQKVDTKHHETLLPPELERLLPGIQDVPEFDLQGKMGPMDYIDFLKPGAFRHTGSVLVKGTDRFQRKFISYDRGHGVITFFQRFTHNPTYWMHGGQLPRDYEAYGWLSLCEDSAKHDNRILLFTEGLLLKNMRV
jgi:hypothetical protein